MESDRKGRGLDGWIESRSVLGVLVLAASASAAQDVGFEGPRFSGAGATPTESKPENKLWFHGGSWWGSLWSTSADAFVIHRLDWATHAWIDTGVVLDARPNSHGDALSDGAQLYFLSHQFTTGSSSSGNPMHVARYDHDLASGVYAPHEGFPVTIADFSTEAATLARDSTGRLWAAWTQGSRVRISHSLDAETQWSTPIVLPRNTSNLSSDDLCGMVHFNGDRIGVLWSDQNANAYRFSTHRDADEDTVWSTVENATSGESDDHLNMAVHSDGRVFFVGKNAANNLLLLVRSLAGSWQRHVVTQPTPVLTRPIVLLNEQAGTIHVFATGQDTGEVFEKTSSLGSISFPSGTGTVRMRDSSTVFRISNPTSSGQNVDGTTGMVVLAHHDTTGFYWHHDVLPAPPAAGFAASPTSGVVPLTVGFTDQSTGNIVSRSWTFGDGGSSTELDPVHTYTAVGSYTVRLTATGPGGSDTETRTGLIVVLPPPPVASFSASPTTGEAPLAVAFTDASSGVVTAWSWDFGDGATSSVRNPTHTFAAGTFTVALTVTGPGGSDSETRPALIQVSPGPPVFAFASVADARVNEGSPSSNAGSADELRVRGQEGASYHSYLRFDLGAASGTVTSATLRLFCTSASVQGGAVFPTSSSWSETGINWNNKPSATGGQLASLGAVAAGNWYELDVSAAVSAGGPVSFLLTSTSSDSALYSSREGENPPELVLETGSPVPPVAAFAADTLAGQAPLAVGFTDLSTGGPTSWSWSFGDGTASGERSPTHVYTEPGIYTVRLVVSNASGSSEVTQAGLVRVRWAPPERSFLPVADARVNEASPSSNAGTASELRVRAEAGGSYHSYLRFDLTGLTGTVQSARLRLFCTDGSPAGGTLFPTTSAWSETSITWANKPPASGGQLASLGSVTANTWYELDVTAAVQAGQPLGLLLTGTSSNSALYSSREGANPPELVVVTSTHWHREHP